MHVLLIHQAFVSPQEPGGTRHHELALYFASRGHRVTIIASPVSYLTGKTSLPFQEEPASPPASLLAIWSPHVDYTSFSRPGRSSRNDRPRRRRTGRLARDQVHDHLSSAHPGISTHFLLT